MCWSAINHSFNHSFNRQLKLLNWVGVLHDTHFLLSLELFVLLQLLRNPLRLSLALSDDLLPLLFELSPLRKVQR
jgi:hypothetical protein